MMPSNFHIAFKVEVFHSYFENAICNCIKFNATPPTASILQRYHFRIRKTINGFGLQTNSDAISALLPYITKATGATSFNFDICNTDENFNIFTALPMDWIGQLQYDSTSVWNERLQSEITLVPALADLPFTPTLGSLVIHFDDLVNRETQNEPLFFKINYQARSTQWLYYVINKSSIDLNNAKVIGKSGIEFHGPESTTIATGEQALVFSSYKNLIPLSQSPVYKFDLVDVPLQTVDGEMAQRHAVSKTIIKGLPNPKIAQFVSTENGQKLVSSPMYVYV